MLDTVFIGIDVSSKANVVHVMDHIGNKLWSDQYVNSAPGADTLVAQLLKDPRCNKAFLRFGLEATGVYGKEVAMFLRETRKIHPSRKAVHVLNPKQVKRFRDSYSDLPKDDFTDAYVIADSLRFGRIALKEGCRGRQVVGTPNLDQMALPVRSRAHTREKPLPAKPVPEVFLDGAATRHL